MSKELDEIRRKLQNQFRSTSDIVFPVVVTDIDEKEFTCTVRRDDQVDYFDVRLRGLVNSDMQGLALIPKIQSIVLVCRIGTSNELFVVQFTEIDKVVFTSNNLELKIDTDNIDLTKGNNIKIHIDADKLEVINDQVIISQTNDTLSLKSSDVLIDADNITLNGGSNGAMVKIKELEKNLTSIKNYIEAMNAALPTAFTAIGAAMASAGANGATSYQGAMAGQIINLSNMADDKITH